MTEFNLTSLKLSVPRFIEGAGSVIKINLTKYLPQYPAYNPFSTGKSLKPPDVVEVYATYNEGSKYKMISTVNPIEVDIGTYAFSFEILSLSVLAFIFPFLYNRIRKQRKKSKLLQARFLYNILKEMIDIRSILRDDLMYECTFPDSWNSMSYESKQQIILNISDYIYIDDLYSNVASRNKDISSKQINCDILKKKNEQCLSLAENALKIVDWKRYDIAEIKDIEIPHYDPLKVGSMAFFGVVGLLGLSHIYIGRITKGIEIAVIGHILFIIFLVSSFNPSLLPMYYPLLIMYYSLLIFQVVDAMRLAKKFNQHVSKTGKELW